MSSILHAADANRFAQPLPSPAGGNQVLELAGTNTGIFRMSGEALQINSIFTLSAAIGNDATLGAANEFWSLQLWADTNGSSSFEGSGSDTFIGQQFGSSSTAVTAAEGQWALNSFSFETGGDDSLSGQELIVFLNNFDTGSSYYDNVSLSVSTVPEPSSVCILSVGLLALIVGRRRREAHLDVC
ncbi:hypothetical protein K239x_30030 [Planctomycetes bacterium K23_9]|uniref:Ice-binding protein C-terminal domain-containing protein n=2 Tax=Stieleria marina TaxID=1930275 RepID=A0A517NV65_9BACT|nr:hypothetical protein K239x_30030 [Planctomycetes bacterium K23_9]